MTHTPGPWRVHSEHADRIIVNGCCVYQVGNLAVSGSYAPGVLGEPDHDDVRLMAAAPELFAACLRLMEYWQHGTAVDGGSEAADLVFNAVSKAGGWSDEQGNPT